MLVGGVLRNEAAVATVTVEGAPASSRGMLFAAAGGARADSAPATTTPAGAASGSQLLAQDRPSAGDVRPQLELGLDASARQDVSADKNKV